MHHQSKTINTPINTAPRFCAFQNVAHKSVPSFGVGAGIDSESAAMARKA